LSRPDAFPHAQPLPPALAAALARAGGRLGLFTRVVYFSELPSTNDLAAEGAERGAAEGTVIVAGLQTAGRGRFGRLWSSPAGAGLYVSIVLRPTPQAIPLLTLTAGVGLAEGIEAATGLVAALKWPNDLYVGMRKLGGILSEASSSGGGAAHAIVGFGINVRPAPYPPEVAARATSLEAELGMHVDAGLVLAECLAALSARYDDLRQDRSRELLAAWCDRARPLLGRRVEWDNRDATLTGVAEGVDDDGALLVRTQAGLVRVISGEVRWI
jgi:BirA family biotin operon repressor/biotin-[acetyl-CoA-carboxylase] ligase